ncbi:MAG TPA: hypothetical protein VL024_08570 [Castellaniella sp.]|nr:hypothetical protein [Castellaniella sp.]
MTEQDHSKPTPEPATPPDTATAASAADAPDARKQPKKHVSGWVWAVVLLIVLVIALGAGLWYQGRENRSLRADMTQQGG